MTEILCENLTPDQAETYGLVLTASGLPYFTKKSSRGWQIWVDETIRIKALDLISQYNLENTDRQPIDGAPNTQKERKTLSALWVSLFMLAIHVLTSQREITGQLVRTYSSDAFEILHGEVYRAVTSLMFHVDYPHLAGNLTGLAVLGTALCKITGAGSGWLIILLSGVCGNLINAAVIQGGHDSIGASTAVFGALGFLAAYQFCRKITAGDRRIKAWIPLAGGLALLGFLGSGAHTDLTAHLFGFLAGICLGLVYPRYLSWFQQRTHQIISAAAVIFLVGFAAIWPLVF